MLRGGAVLLVATMLASAAVLDAGRGALAGRGAVASTAEAVNARLGESPLLGIVWGGDVTSAVRGGELARLDPRSLRPLGRTRLPLDAFSSSGWSFSPDRSRIVFGGLFGPMKPALRFADVLRLRLTGDVQLRGSGVVLATGWLAPRRAVAVVQQPWGAGPLRLVVVDPLDRRVLLRRRLAGASELERAVATRRSLVLLLAPARGPRRTAVGAARLLSIDRGGRVRSVLLARLKAGSDSLRSGAGYLYAPGCPGSRSPKMAHVPSS